MSNNVNSNINNNNNNNMQGFPSEQRNPSSNPLGNEVNKPQVDSNSIGIITITMENLIEIFSVCLQKQIMRIKEKKRKKIKIKII